MNPTQQALEFLKSQPEFAALTEDQIREFIELEALTEDELLDFDYVSDRATVWLEEI